MMIKRLRSAVRSITVSRIVFMHFCYFVFCVLSTSDLMIRAAYGLAETVGGEAPRGVSRRIAPVGERPLIVVPPLEDVKLSDSGVRDYNSYMIRSSLYRKENGRWVLMRRENSAFSQQSERPGASTWKRMKFDDYVKARPGLAGYDILTVSENAYNTMKDAECNAIGDPEVRRQCLEFRKHRRTEWLDGLLQKNDTGDVVHEDVVPLRGVTYQVAAAPLEEVVEPPERHPELGKNPCLKKIP